MCEELRRCSIEGYDGMTRYYKCEKCERPCSVRMHEKMKDLAYCLQSGFYNFAEFVEVVDV